MRIRVYQFLALLGVILTIGLQAPLALAQDAEDPVHDELRMLLLEAQTALSARDEEALLALFTDDVAFTAMNNEVVHGKEEAQQYYEKMLLGSNSLLEDFSASFEPDMLSLLYGDKKTAISTGEAEANFALRTGGDLSIPLRWSAFLVNEGGEWKIAALHFSANIFDNPLSAPLRNLAWVGLVFTLIFGFSIGYFVRSRRRQS